MKIRELVALLQMADQELNVYVLGENSGLDDLSMSDVEIVTVNLDVHSVCYLGKHEVVGDRDRFPEHKKARGIVIGND